MPIRYKIFANRKLVYALGEGQITLADLLRHIEELSQDPRYIPPMNKIVDYRNATLATLTTAEANRFTAEKSHVKDIFKNETCAIVATTDLDYGLSRAHSARAEIADIKTSVFRDIKDALAWLHIDLDEDEMKF